MSGGWQPARGAWPAANQFAADGGLACRHRLASEPGAPKEPPRGVRLVAVLLGFRLSAVLLGGTLPALPQVSRARFGLGCDAPFLGFPAQPLGLGHRAVNTRVVHGKAERPLCAGLQDRAGGADVRRCLAQHRIGRGPPGLLARRDMRAPAFAPVRRGWQRPDRWRLAGRAWRLTWGAFGLARFGDELQDLASAFEAGTGASDGRLIAASGLGYRVVAALRMRQQGLGRAVAWVWGRVEHGQRVGGCRDVGELRAGALDPALSGPDRDASRLGYLGRGGRTQGDRQRSLRRLARPGYALGWRDGRDRACLLQALPGVPDRDVRAAELGGYQLIAAAGIAEQLALGPAGCRAHAGRSPGQRSTSDTLSEDGAGRSLGLASPASAWPGLAHRAAVLANTQDRSCCQPSSRHSAVQAGQASSISSGSL